MDREKEELIRELESAKHLVEKSRLIAADRSIERAWRLIEDILRPEIPDELLPSIKLVDKEE